MARIPQTETLGERNANPVADFLPTSQEEAVKVLFWQEFGNFNKRVLGAFRAVRASHSQRITSKTFLCRTRT